jgi:hypothetical protein
MAPKVPSGSAAAALDPLEAVNAGAIPAPNARAKVKTGNAKRFIGAIVP